MEQKQKGNTLEMVNEKYSHWSINALDNLNSDVVEEKISDL
jgi:hypothetical protein